MTMNPQYKRDMFLQALPFKYDVTADATGKKPFALPNTFIPFATLAMVETAFDGTSPTMKAGYAGTLNAIFDTTDIDLTQTGPQFILSRSTAPLSADQEIILTVSEGSSAAGVVHGLVLGWFIDPNSVD